MIRYFVRFSFFALSLPPISNSHALTCSCRFRKSKSLGPALCSAIFALESFRLGALSVLSVFISSSQPYLRYFESLSSRCQPTLASFQSLWFGTNPSRISTNKSLACWTKSNAESSNLGIYHYHSVIKKASGKDRFR